MKRIDKLSRLVALYDDLPNALATIEHERARRVRDNWKRVRSMYADPDRHHPRSLLATGLEQGLRETPMFFRPLPFVMRVEAAKALDRAIAAHCPDFYAKDAARLEKAMARGRIRGDTEFYLAQYQADPLEGDACKEQEHKAWCALIGDFETRGR